MKKFFISLVCLLLFTAPTFAMTISELQSNPSRYAIVYKSSDEIEVVDTYTMQVRPNNNNLVWAKATVYAVTPNPYRITRYENMYSYDFNSPNGIKWYPLSIVAYDYDGNYTNEFRAKGPAEIQTENDLQSGFTSQTGSPSFNAALFIYHALYMKK